MKILVAGIGNIFLGDDGFGVEVARQLLGRTLPAGVRVVDFGIRGMDLVYALMDGYDACVFIDIAARGQAPGTLSLIEHDTTSEPTEVTLDTHGMEPLKVLALARVMGAPPTRVFVVACEPQFIVNNQEDYEDVVVELSAPVRGAMGGALQMIESLITQIIEGGHHGTHSGNRSDVAGSGGHRQAVA